MASQLGKRFTCPTCETEVLCTKPGTGSLECCGKEMEIKEPKALASAD